MISRADDGKWECTCDRCGEWEQVRAPCMCDARAVLIRDKGWRTVEGEGPVDENGINGRETEICANCAALERQRSVVRAVP